MLIPRGFGAAACGKPLENRGEAKHTGARIDSDDPGFQRKGAPMAAAKPKTATVSLKQITADIAGKQEELSKKAVTELLDTFLTALTKHISKGTKVRIPGLGIFSVRKRAARMGRNPATGEAIKIKASKKVAFRPAKELKESI
jgi:DNA-binding protein HU-beta